MGAIEPNGVALALFVATFAAGCLSFFTLVGMFPASARPVLVAGHLGNLLVLANLVLLLVLLGGVALFAHETLRWTSVVVAGGLIFLFVPSVFEIIPGTWRDSRGGLLLLGALQLAALALLISPLQKLSAL
ncbi:hypothetical protein [Bradyrhizobium erythrophlei]|jgi:hypothetical protein|uniref:Uncharacterized protein n=1 Tax=Bradyrhizobium erythrophlei TaxID=1437360 RepID=A0A1M7T2X5_9BRAD|nr:hypothetical protein [Bradyrhizobium erythrophlei]SHN65059.1 hypothetical protein SAMN05444170_0661 [Bradyrhizobium erythrophlei]